MARRTLLARLGRLLGFGPGPEVSPPPPTPEQEVEELRRVRRAIPAPPAPPTRESVFAGIRRVAPTKKPSEFFPRGEFAPEVVPVIPEGEKTSYWRGRPILRLDPSYFGPRKGYRDPRAVNLQDAMDYAGRIPVNTDIFIDITTGTYAIYVYPSDALDLKYLPEPPKRFEPSPPPSRESILGPLTQTIPTQSRGAMPSRALFPNFGG